MPFSLSTAPVFTPGTSNRATLTWKSQNAKDPKDKDIISKPSVNMKHYLQKLAFVDHVTKNKGADRTLYSIAYALMSV